MIESLTLLLACELAGEIVVRLTGLPIPGPVLGMVILFSGLCVIGRVPPPLQKAVEGLLQHLSLLFVPAGVGVMLYLSVIQREWLPITAAVLASTILTLIVTALVMQLFARSGESHESGDGETGA